jgi:hypothetical protein
MMTNKEREDLRKLIQARGKAAKARVESYAAVLLADAEEKLAKEFKFNDEAWAELTRTRPRW